MRVSLGAVLGACLLAAAHGVSLRSSAVGFFDADPATVVSCAPLAKVVGRKEGTLTDGVPSGTAMPSGARRCAWLVEAYPESEDTPADIKSEVSLFFIRVQLPAPQDDGSCKEAIKVYEGCDSDARLLHDNVFCGKTVPPMIKTNKRCLYVEFRADHDTKGQAFEANFKTRIVSPGTPWSGKLAARRADLEAKQEQVEMRLTRSIKAANASAQHILTVMRGPAGNHGPRGVRGPAGEHGPDGPVGPRGEKTKEAAPKGNPGVKGPRGRQGMDGDEGTDGTGGAAGEKGATGITGMSGEGFTGEEAAVREPLQRLLSANLAARIRSILKEKPELETKLAEGVVNAFQDAAHKDVEHKYKNSALPLILDGLKSNPGILGKVIRTSTESDKMSSWEVIGVFKDHMKEWAANVFQPKPMEGKEGNAEKAGKAGKAGGTPEEIAEAAAIATGLPVSQHMIMDKMEKGGRAAPPAPYPRGKYPLQQGRADDPVDPASCDMGAYAQCTANIGAAPSSKVDPKEMCAYQVCYNHCYICQSNIYSLCAVYIQPMFSLNVCMMHVIAECTKSRRKSIGMVLFSV